MIIIIIWTTINTHNFDNAITLVIRKLGHNKRSAKDNFKRSLWVCVRRKLLDSKTGKEITLNGSFIIFSSEFSISYWKKSSKSSKILKEHLDILCSITNVYKSPSRCSLSISVIKISTWMNESSGRREAQITQ